MAKKAQNNLSNQSALTKKCGIWQPFYPVREWDLPTISPNLPIFFL